MSTLPAIRTRIITPIAAALLTAGVASPANAQGTAQNAAPAPAAIRAPDATLRHEFTAVSAVRELADGRLLIVDAGERALVVADWRTGAVTRIGREGGGAGEYNAPRLLFSLAGDSSLLADPRNGRWILLVGDSIVTMVGADAPVVRLIGGGPMGVDAGGFAFATRPQIVGGRPRLDSLMLLRASRRTAAVDTVGRLLVRPVSVMASGTIDPTKPVAVTVNPLAVGEQATVFPDGWVAIARLAPYRVDWVDPTGRRTSGRALPFDAVTVDDREKRAALAIEARLTGREPQAAGEVGEWPATMPPFLSGALLAAADGTVWIRRAPTAAHPEARYDVVDRRGSIVRRVDLQVNERVVGVGRTALFTIQTDDDGIERLRRRPLAGARVSLLEREE